MLRLQGKASWSQRELCVVIGKTCKNLSDQNDPLDYGYTMGNDVSSGCWQLPDRSGQQVGFAKDFDKFAPIEPTVCSTTQIPKFDALTSGHMRQWGRATKNW